MQIRNLSPGDADLAEPHRVLVQLRPHLDLDDWRSVMTEGAAQGLRFTALYDEGRCVAVAGWRLLACTHTIRKLYVDDLVTDADSRSQGHGAALLEHLRRHAVESGCRVLDLDSGVQRHEAHRFYFRQGMHITSHHFAELLE